MAAVRPAQPVPRTTVSRTEFSIAFRFMSFDIVSGLLRCLFFMCCAAIGRGVEPGNVRTEGRPQPQRRAILREYLRGAKKYRLIRALVDLLAARQAGGALPQPLNPDSRSRSIRGKHSRRRGRPG